MGMFSDLMDRIFDRDETERSAGEPDLPPPEQPIEGGAPSAKPPAETGESTEASAPVPVPEVDVEARLTEMEKEHPDDLDWRRSIVDLLNLVGMDSSYGARKELALELGYTQGDIDSKGSAEMNMWLHKEVMKRLAQNGAKVPTELLQ